MQLPPGFIKMMHDLLGDEAECFLNAMQNNPVVSVRLNSRKPSDAFNGERVVKWCPTGRYLDERPVFTLDPLLHAGAYYVQDASSMIHYECIKRILSRLSADLNDSCGNKAEIFPVSLLDLCAAPGGKTTAMIDALPDGSRIIANEYVGKRAAVLKENLTKWGYPLASVSSHDSSWFADNGHSFDIVAVDAPCSGEGMMRKDSDAISQWSLELIGHCANLQKEILSNAAKVVRPGGFLIYSTCTFNRIENEENAEFITRELGMAPFDLSFPEEWGIPGGIDTHLPVYRFMPHKTEGEGLFLAVFRKPGEYSRRDMPLSMPQNRCQPEDRPTPATSRKHRQCRHDKQANIKQPANDGTLSKEVPAMAEILSCSFNRSNAILAELTKDQALSYLRRESLTLPPEIPKGIVIATYKGLPLGPMKNIGQRANNLYPKSWRILMR